MGLRRNAGARRRSDLLAWRPGRWLALETSPGTRRKFHGSPVTSTATGDGAQAQATEHRSRRSWKPNVQEKRLFSYIHDRHIRVKVTTHALKCIDKAGGLDEYLLKTPYHKMGTELGLAWKAKIEKMYAELGNMEVGLFSPEEEAKIEKGFEELKLAKKEARKEARRALAKKEMEECIAGGDQTAEANQIEEGDAEDFEKEKQ